MAFAAYLGANVPSLKPAGKCGAVMNDHSQNRIWQRAEIESPCVNICVIHPRAGICAGCYRTLDEIGLWSQMTADDRRSVMADLPERAGLLKKRQGGRAGRMTGEGQAIRSGTGRVR